MPWKCVLSEQTVRAERTHFLTGRVCTELPISRSPQGVCDCESECAELPLGASCSALDNMLALPRRTGHSALLGRLGPVKVVHAGVDDVVVREGRGR